ncbi:helicase-related protein [Lysinibacillus capsici]|uniref:helicase-related protein n=1 Tax=Lysinibacillus capsici TaxID=2115968 RepID=UPI00325FB8A1
MPRIFDNINQKLVDALRLTLQTSYSADFCIGYFNLRGWKQLSNYVEHMDGTSSNACRILIGMQKLPQEELKELFSNADEHYLDRKTVLNIKSKLLNDLKKQLIFGSPTNSDEQGLRDLIRQLKEKKVKVKLYLRTTLHAKLYLMHRNDAISHIVGYLGSSNLTFSGLKGQGELNIDVLDIDACNKLSNWFNERWNDRFSLDITEELIQLLSESWAREEVVSPYNIYMKMIYHLSEEAQQGIRDVSIPKIIEDELLEFQETALKIAVQHIQKRNGVIIGDVVGLGKTMLATSISKLYQENYLYETLIICPAKLVTMWENYISRYKMNAIVISMSNVIEKLDQLKKKFGLIIIDESHNLRNKDGKRYKAIQVYINKSDAKVVLLTATPYNKSYYDLSNQLRLFISPDYQFNIRPEKLLNEMGETEFLRQYQCSPNSLEAFEHSSYPEDWQELMRLYMVRRTRSFILDNYSAIEDGRRYIKFKNGNAAYFPTRIPKTVTYDNSKNSNYAKLYSEEVLEKINSLCLPRYLLSDYIDNKKKNTLSEDDKIIVENLVSARYLIGFYRTNVFKRLESSGEAFIKSIKRHLFRDGLIIYACKNKLLLPIGKHDFDVLMIEEDDLEDELLENEVVNNNFLDVKYLDKLFERMYEKIEHKSPFKYKWVDSTIFNKKLLKDLENDQSILLNILSSVDFKWEPQEDEKFIKLLELISKNHANEKILIFSQFTDTVDYLYKNIQAAGISDVEKVTGSSENSTEIVWKFSPGSNGQTVSKEIRVLVATDSLSEGQNLQDASIVINYDLPWAIIRLIQRAGRVDRIGQMAEKILCYSFMPAEGIEKVINLRNRLLTRLSENAEVVGTDETFFEDQINVELLNDLYNEKSNILDEQEFLSEVDLSSYAYEIWKKEIGKNPDLEKDIRELPHVVYSSKKKDDFTQADSVIVYLRNKLGNDALVWMNEDGQKITSSQYEIIKAIECVSSTGYTKKSVSHHELVAKALQDFKNEQKNIGGQLGKPSGARFKIYEILKHYTTDIKNSIFLDEFESLNAILNLIYKYPLTRYATDILNSILRNDSDTSKIIETLHAIHAENRLCIKLEQDKNVEPIILCSMGLN